jgi:tetratricopeptide (TPR) repeat protein
MPENPQAPIPPDDHVARVTLPLGPEAIQSTRPPPRPAAGKEDEQRAEKEQVAAPPPVAAVRAGRRRRWWEVALAAALVVLAASLTGGALWWRHGRAASREEVTTALAEATRLRDAGRFQESREFLENALARLGLNGPSDLVDHAGTALTDTRLAERLDAARQRLFDNADAGNPLNFAETEKEYEAALNEAVLVREGEDKDVLAARVHNSPVREAVLAAIEDWAAVTADEPRREWLLAVACAADPDPDRDRLRRPELWRDRMALVRLAEEPVPKSLSPGLAVALGRRAISANAREPLALLVEVQKVHPQDFWLNVTTGWYSNAERKWDEAMEYDRAALASRPRAAVACCNLGMTLRGRRKLDEAVEQFQEALRLDPKSANAHCGMGLALHENRKPDEAMEHYQEALRLNPQHANAQVALGVVLAEKNRINEAIDNYEAALRINPRHAGAHYSYGNALRARNEIDRAIGQYQQALNSSPRYAAAHNGLGIALHAKHQLDQAITEYEAAIGIEPENATYRANLGTTLRLKGRLDEAITRFHEALGIDSKNAFAQNGLGHALSDKGDPDEAIPHSEAAIGLDPNNAGFRVNLGNALFDLGRHDAAIKQYKDALQISAKNSMAQNGLGNALFAKGQVDQAVRCFQQAVELDANNSSAHSNLGLALLYGRCQPAEASPHFQRAAQIRPNSALTQFNVGQGLLANGQFTDAREVVRRSLRLSAAGQPYHELYLQAMRQLEDCERLPALEARLPAILQGKEKPAGAAEALQLAWLCQVRLRFAAAARLYANSFAADPTPANELSAGHRFNAARCAALASAGWGDGAPPPGDAERIRLRGQALEWLRADLAAWRKQVAAANPAALPAARRSFALWLREFRLFAVREKEELAKLPGAERTAWEKLWADVEALRTEARATRLGEALPPR